MPVGFLDWRFGGDQPAEWPQVSQPQIEELMNAYEMWQRILGKQGLGMNRLNMIQPQQQQGSNGF